MNAVQESAELDRILAIPRRVWSQDQADQVVRDLSNAFRTPHGVETLFPTQALALLEIGQLGGLLGPMPVGSGKTLVTLLAPRMLGAKRPLLLLPASLLKKTEKEIPKYRKNWVLPAHIKLVSYESLAMDSHAEFLNAYQPDLIMADEGHKLFNTGASCCKRLGRYMREHYSTPLVVLSGSLISRQIEDLGHLTNWSLKDRNPIPEHFGTVQEWGRALNVNTNDARRLLPGALARLRHPSKPNQCIREAFQDRLLQTPGVVTFRGKPLPTKLRIQSHLLEAPDLLADVWDTLRDDWETPDGWEMVDGIEAWRHARELSVGCYYRWNPRPPKEWNDARKEWGAACREILSTNRRNLDTELQVKKAIHHYPHHITALARWKELRPTFEPNVEAVWESDHAVDWILDWAAQAPGIVWVSHKFLGHKLAERGLPYYANGGLCTKTGQAIEDAPPTASICASVSSNGTGRNLQHWGRNLVVSGPPNGKQWEQLLGRTHRTGQKRAEVTVDVAIGCLEDLKGFWRAVEDAQFAESMLGQPQKLCNADLTGVHEPASVYHAHSAQWRKQKKQEE